MAAQQRIVPLLRIPAGDHGIVGAARFYLDAFRPLEEAGLEVGAGAQQDEGVEVSIAGFRIGLQDAADSAGHPALMTPATSFTVNVDPCSSAGPGREQSDPGGECRPVPARAALDTVWDALSDASAGYGTGLEPAVLMPLDKYPFSPATAGSRTATG